MGVGVWKHVEAESKLEPGSLYLDEKRELMFVLKPWGSFMRSH